MSAMVPTDTAVLLVAGCARRLGDAAQGRPKCLVPLGAQRQSLLELAVRRLAAVGVRHLVLATGYQAEQVARAAHQLLASRPERYEAQGGIEMSVRLCPNPRYAETQNAVSLWCCREALEGRPFLKLDGDVLFPTEVLRRTLQVASQPGTDLAVAVDRSAELDEEAMKVALDGERIVAFGKELDPRRPRSGTSFAETLGIEWLSTDAGVRLFQILERFLQQGRTDVYYEAAYQRLAEEGFHVRAADVTGLPWTEVDTPEDLRRARRLADRVAAYDEVQAPRAVAGPLGSGA